MGSTVTLLPDGNASAVGDGAGARGGTGASAGRAARAGAGEEADGFSEGAGAGAGAGGCETRTGPFARYASMSCFVTRPEIPVPSTCEMSTPFSSAIARTTGDERRFSTCSWDSAGPGGAEEEEGVEDC